VGGAHTRKHGLVNAPEGARWTTTRLRDADSGRVAVGGAQHGKVERGNGWVEVFSPALLIARSCMRVYDRFMVRKCASIGFGLGLVVALGFAMVHPHPLKAAGGSTGFSTPCEPASPLFKAVSESKVVSTIDSTFAAENAGAPAGVVRGSHVEAVSRSIPPPGARGLPSLVASPPAGQLLIPHSKGSRSRRVRERRSPPVLCIWS
jgi:hypothetical protein